MRKSLKRALMVMVAAAAITVITAFPAFAGQWQQEANGWRWLNDQGNFTANKWERIDGNKDGVYENYYFNPEGYLLVNTTTPDGYLVNGDGAQLIDGKVNILDMGYDDWEWETVATNIKVEGSLKRETPDLQFPEVEYEEIDPYELAYRIVELVNEERASKGLGALVVNEELMENAMLRAEEISVFFSHTRPDGSSSSSAISEKYSMYGENIAWEKFDTLENLYNGVTNGWLNSSGHKTIMLNGKFEFTGIGVCIADDGVYIAQEFIKK